MNPNINSLFFEDDGFYPNHPFLPTLVYYNCLDSTTDEVERLFHQNRWANTWTGGVFDYHHYHSKTHEVLAVLEGTSTLTLGGPNGKVVDVKKGDLIVIPAGVAHKNEGATEDFQVMGAYPYGESFDLKTGEKHEYEEALKTIPEAKKPSADPILGKRGPLMELWV
ncbi:cupin domain-containing protein [Halobacillus fulvus]|nr:cupin domain-containing protein [Halobacillus fulvus]